MKHKTHSEKILIIEDDEPTQEAILLKFAQLGYSADCARDGEEGLEKLQIHNYAGVLLDVWMPKIDGFAFLEKKSHLEKFRDVPVIVFSNFSQSEFVERAITLGARGYLVKAHHSAQEIVEEMVRCIAHGQCQIDR